MAQWLRICLPMQETRVRALVWEDPTCHAMQQNKTKQNKKTKTLQRTLPSAWFICLLEPRVLIPSTTLQKKAQAEITMVVIK